MDQTQISLEKQALRRLAAQRLDLLPAGYLARSGLAIARQVANIPEYREADTVLAFYGTDREIDTVPLLTQILTDGKRLLLPRCIAPGTMEAREVFSLTHLHAGKFGIMEPKQNSPVVDPSAISLTLVPCLAADPSGNRLGHGGGYYDRYLPACHGAAILLCPERLVMERIPQEAHDSFFSILVTERSVFRNSCRT